ncbi:MAG: ABC transporter permease subunit [Thermoplasmataceae archaeon]
MINKNIKWWAFLFAPSIFLLLVIGIPFIYVVINFLSLNKISAFFGTGTLAMLSRQAFINSFAQGIDSALLSLIIGFPLGLFIGRYALRYTRVLKSFIILPFFMPSIVVVLAFLSLFGKSSPLVETIPLLHHLSSGFTGIIAINAFFNAPLVAFLTSTNIERSHHGIEEASILLGAGNFNRFVNIWGRNGIKGAVGGTILSFLYSFSGFAAPLIIGGPSNFTVETWIYFVVKEESLVQIGVIFGLLQSLFLIIPLVIYLYIISKQRPVDDLTYYRSERKKNRHQLSFTLGSIFVTLFIVFELAIFVSIIISSIDIGWNSSINANAYTDLFGSVSSSLDIPAYLPFINTIFYGVATSIIVTSLGILWITGKRRLNSKNDSIWDFMQYLSFIIPSIMMALSVSLLYEYIISPSFLWVLIIGVQSAVSIPVVLRVISGGFSEIPSSLTDSSRILGGSPLFEVELPLAGSALATALMFGFALSIGEFTATNFLSTNTFMPLSVEIYSLQSLRLAAASYAAASILMIMSFVFFFAIQKAGDRFIGIR